MGIGSSVLGRRKSRRSCKRDEELNALLAVVANDGSVLPAAANDGALSTDVLREILLRLPAKELCRLRLVCRSWRSLTSDAAFAAAHASRHGPLFAALDMTTCCEVHVLDLRGNVIRRIPLAELCFDISEQPDLLCVSSCFGLMSFLINPAANEVITMRKGKKASQYQTILGHVPSTGEYKLLRIPGHFIEIHGGYVQRFYVRTLGGSPRWRERPRPLVPVETSHGDTAVIGGVAYFLLSFLNDEDEEPPNVHPDSIASFDLATEQWRPTMVGPVSSSLVDTDKEMLLYRQHRGKFRLAKLNGFLVIVYHDYHQDYCAMDLWFLVDTKKWLWTKRYSMKCAIFCSLYRFGSPPYPLVVLGDGRIVFRVVPRILGTYDPATSTWAHLVKMGDYAAIRVYKGSLLCVGLHHHILGP
ncbi:hypothetical protein ACP4OV_024470 [Aristida adscensionis]